MFTSRGTTGAAARVSVTFNNYQAILHDSLYLRSYWVSLRTAAIVTLICLFLRYPPPTLFISRTSAAAQRILVPMVALPFRVSSLIRAYAWITLLRGEGQLTNLLRWAGLLHPHAVLLRARFVFNEVVCGVDGR